MNTQDKNIIDKDRETLISIVKEMAASTSGKQSTKHWAKDTLWLDIPPFAHVAFKLQLKCLTQCLAVLSRAMFPFFKWTQF